jgi:hypothetical protein
MLQDHWRHRQAGARGSTRAARAAAGAGAASDWASRSAGAAPAHPSAAASVAAVGRATAASAAAHPGGGPAERWWWATRRRTGAPATVQPCVCPDAMGARPRHGKHTCICRASAVSLHPAMHPVSTHAAVIRSFCTHHHSTWQPSQNDATGGKRPATPNDATCGKRPAIDTAVEKSKKPRQLAARPPPHGPVEVVISDFAKDGAIFRNQQSPLARHIFGIVQSLECEDVSRHASISRILNLVAMRVARITMSHMVL